MLLKTKGSKREVLSELLHTSEGGLKQATVGLSLEPVKFSEYNNSIHQPVVSFPTHARGVQDLYYGTKRAVLQARGRAVTNPTTVTSAEYKQYIHEVYTHASQTKEQADRVVFSSFEKQPTSPSAYTPLSFNFPAGYVRQLPPTSFERPSPNMFGHSLFPADTALNNYSSTIRNESYLSKTNSSPQTTPKFARSYNHTTCYTSLEKATTGNCLNHEPPHSRDVEDCEGSSCIILDSDDNLKPKHANQTMISPNSSSQHPTNHDSSCLQETKHSNEVICISDSEEELSEVICNKPGEPSHSETIPSEAANSEIACDELSNNQINCSKPVNIKLVQKETVHLEVAQPESSNTEIIYEELVYNKTIDSVANHSDLTHFELNDNHSNNSELRCEPLCDSLIIKEPLGQCISVREVSLSNHTLDCHENQSGCDNIDPPQMRIPRSSSQGSSCLTDASLKASVFKSLDDNTKCKDLLSCDNHSFGESPHLDDSVQEPILSPADSTVLLRSQYIINWLNEQNPQNYDIVASCSTLPLVCDTSASLSISDKIECSTAKDILTEQTDLRSILIKPSLNKPGVDSSDLGSVHSAVEDVKNFSTVSQFQKLPSISGSEHNNSEASWYSEDKFYDCITELDEEGNVIARPIRAGKKRRRQTENYRDILNQSRELAELGPLPREVSTPYSLRRILPDPSPEKTSNRRLSAGPTHTTSLTRANATPYLLREPHELHQVDTQIQDVQDVSVENLPKLKKTSRAKRARNQ